MPNESITPSNDMIAAIIVSIPFSFVQPFQE